MAALVSHTTIDCTDAFALSTWWKSVLDYTDLPDDPNAAGDEECMIVDPHSGHRLLFIEVPDPTPGKNRIHLDLRPRTGTRDQEIARLATLGARVTADHRGIYGPGSGWATMADPEGNVFCVLRSAAELND